MTEKKTAEEKLRNIYKRSNDYKRDHYDRIVVLAPKGTREHYATYAEKQGLSMTQFIMKIVDEWIEEQNRTTYKFK